MKCGYCGTDIDLDGDLLHLPECPAPVPHGDEDVMDDDDTYGGEPSDPEDEADFEDSPAGGH